MRAVAPAFLDPVIESQQVFRTVMNAFARPGTVHPLRVELAPPGPLSRTAGAIALALLDYETPVWLDPALAADSAIGDWLRFHTGAPVTSDSAEAAFAFVRDAAGLPPFDRFAQGTMEYPDRSATLVVQVDAFGAGVAIDLAGPGIAEMRSFAISPAPAGLAARLAENRARFPRGVDLIFVTDDSVAALPRSVRVLRGG